MIPSKTNDDFFKDSVIGHPAGLFVLFFTEMWERFSYYGMRALLVLFLTANVLDNGWGWTSATAMSIYGSYTSIAYLTPILGGYIADKFLGYRWAVVIGALIMTLGHASMAIESNPFFMYSGLILLVLGNGFFKPNMTSIVSNMYKDHPEKKDGAYTIFYMGVNAGAFLGMLLCGYIGENISWSYGFGLAGIFMFIGMLQFYFTRNIFGSIGLMPTQNEVANTSKDTEDTDKKNPFTTVELILLGFVAFFGLTWVINDPLSKIFKFNFPWFDFKIKDTSGANIMIVITLITFLFLLIKRIVKYESVVRDRMIAVILMAVITVFFWASFEQAGGSMNLFARDYTDRMLSGNSLKLFFIADTLINIIPILIISWVLFKLCIKTFKNYFIGNSVLAIGFLLIWGIIIWKINTDFNKKTYEISFMNQYNKIQTDKITTTDNLQLSSKILIGAIPNQDVILADKEARNPILAKVDSIQNNDTYSISFLNKYDAVIKTRINSKEKLTVGKEIKIVDNSKTTIRIINERSNPNLAKITATIIKQLPPENEIPATWFQIFNSLFIISLAPLVSKIWESKFNPFASFKSGYGMILLGIGFGLLALGSSAIPAGAKTASVSLIWLILAYLFHTLGELFISPVGLSYVSKLVPARMIGMMFGVFYLAIAIGNKIAGTMGGEIEEITKEYSMSGFFLIFTIIPFVLGAVIMALTPIMKKLMHGIK